MSNIPSVEAIERFRAVADPDRYKKLAEQHKTELVQQGERIMLQYELSVGDPNMPETERETMLENLESSMSSVLWRIAEIDEILASYAVGQEAGMNRSARRRLLRTQKKAEKTSDAPDAAAALVRAEDGAGDLEEPLE